MPDRKRRRLPAADARASEKVSAPERVTRVSRRGRLLEEALRREQGREWHGQGQEWHGQGQEWHGQGQEWP